MAKYKCEKGEDQYKFCKSYDMDYCADCPHGISQEEGIQLQTTLSGEVIKKLKQSILNEEQMERSKEKEAIKDLKCFKSMRILYGSIMISFTVEQLEKYQNAVDIVLNLIEHQQKELKRLDRENQHLFENYIPKDAIREKIDNCKFFIPEYCGEFIAIEDLKESLGGE